jgi:hypothetical protein
MKCKKLILLVFLIFVTTSCGVHEFPDENGGDNATVDLTLNLDFDTVMPLYTIVNYTARAIASSDQYDVRYIVKSYRMVNGEYSTDEPYSTNIFTKDDISTLNNSVTVKLPPGKFKIMVWADYVEQGSTANMFYNPDDYSNIGFNGSNYTGSTDLRDAFVGSEEFYLTNNASGMYAKLSGVVLMRRPVAKFKFVATDLNEFIDKYLVVRKNALKKSNNSLASADLSQFKIVFVYPGYLPSIFNMFSDKPVDAAVGIKFLSSITEVNGGEATLGFDYVLVKDGESSVTVSVALYDKNSNLLSAVTDINVPLKRGKLTIVKAKFLTKGATNNGVGIDPSFDDDFNVYFN